MELNPCRGQTSARSLFDYADCQMLKKLWTSRAAMIDSKLDTGNKIMLFLFRLLFQTLKKETKREKDMERKRDKEMEG